MICLEIHSDASRRLRRRRRQTSGSLYGTNANLGASAPAGFNHPANTNHYGTKMNYPDAKDLYGNSMLPLNQGTGLNTFNQNNPQQGQQTNLGFGNNEPSMGNTGYGTNTFYSGSGSNTLLRDPNGNMMMRDSNGNPIQSGN